MVPSPSEDKRPRGQWVWGPPQAGATPPPEAEPAAEAPAAPPWAQAGGKGAKGPPLPRPAPKAQAVQRRPW
eukprot:1035058-Pyramimonas_sp.AAC.1